MSWMTRSAVLALSVAVLQPAAAQAVNDEVVVPIKGGNAVIRPSTLEVTARTSDGQTLELSAPAVGGLGAVKQDGPRSWSYPDKGWQVSVSEAAGRLEVTVKSTKDGRITWPVSGTDKATSSLQVPNGEGLSVPVADPWWNSDKSGLLGDPTEPVAFMKMPFWGYTIGNRGVSYLTPTDIDTDLLPLSVNGRLHTETRHEFGPNTRDYTVDFALTDASPVATAKDYRQWLMSHGGLRTLHDKAAVNPEVRKLYGAFHAYTWGKASTPAGIAALGAGRMWLGEDSGPYSKEAVAAAKKAGYLIGPYASFANAQDPATADNEGSKWPDDLYPKGCVIKKDGSQQQGFGGRGCYLSSEALSMRQIQDRVDKDVSNGANSMFVDVDAAGELFDDHSPDHPMSKAKDKANRLTRMSSINQVVGSEDGAAWSNPAITFAHGSSTPIPSGLWKFEKNKEVWGGYTPANAPDTFFKPVHLPADLAKFMFDPRYRVPLYETVLHDSVISLDRWELSYSKLPDQKKTRALLAMLNNTPLNFVLNGPDRELVDLQRFFEPLHKAAAEQPMTDFRWLTADHQVQQTKFGDTLTVTANFGTGCVEAKLKGDWAPRTLCL